MKIRNRKPSVKQKRFSTSSIFKYLITLVSIIVFSLFFQPVSKASSDMLIEKYSLNGLLSFFVSLSASGEKPTEPLLSNLTSTTSNNHGFGGWANFYPEIALSNSLSSTPEDYVFNSMEPNTGFPVGKTHAQTSTSSSTISSAEPMGNENFAFELPIVSLPGRGLNLNIGLKYNSKVWTRTFEPELIDFSGNTVLPDRIEMTYDFFSEYDTTGSWLAPGFSLDFGKIGLWDSNLYTPDGTIYPLTKSYYFIPQNGQPVPITKQQSTNGTFIFVDCYPECSWTSVAKTASFPDGSTIDYTKLNQLQSHLYPTKITDKNGNYILINYVEGDVPKISSVQDTLGRIIRYNYDSSGSLVTVTAPKFGAVGERQMVRFYYEDLTVVPSFQQVSNGYPIHVNTWAHGVSSNFQPFNRKVLKYVYFPSTQAAYQYDYSSYGMIHTIKKLRGVSGVSESSNQIGSPPNGGYVEAWTKYNYPETPSNLNVTTTPFFTTRTDDWVGRTNSNIEPPPTTVFSYTKDILNSKAKTSVTTPDGVTTETTNFNFQNDGIYDLQNAWAEGLVVSLEIKKNNNILGKTINHWELGDWFDVPVYAFQPRDGNARLTWIENTNEAGQTKKTNFTYIGEVNYQTNLLDHRYFSWNNVRSIKEYGYVDELLRETKIDYRWDTTRTEYWNYGVMYNLPASKSVYEPYQALPSSRIEYEYDNYSAGLLYRSNTVMNSGVSNSRGLVTKETAYENAANRTGAVSKLINYDNLGNVVSVTDALGNTTMTDYSSAFHFSYATLITSAIPDITGLNGSNTPFVNTTDYDFSTGLLKSSTDANNQLTIFEYNDPANRQSKIITPSGAFTSYEYGDGRNNQSTFVKTQSSVEQYSLKTSYSFFDGRGRISSTYSSNGSEWITIDTQYDSLDRGIFRTSNPYKKSSIGGAINPSNDWTTNHFDSLGRINKVTSPDNTKILTNYNGDTVTITDQSGKKKRSIKNALGQLIRVDEPNDAGQLDVNNTPVQSTNYNYDILGNLILVTQNGSNTQQCGGNIPNCSQTRSFTYDSLSRLKSSNNPENGAISYNYDLAGNLESKTDARNIVYTYVYDKMNRLLSQTYVAPTNLPNYQATPNIARKYDNLPNAKGKLIEVSNSLSKTKYTQFDTFGRVTASQQLTTEGQLLGTELPFKFSYAYNLSGSLVSETYPSLKVVRNFLNADGDLSRIVKNGKVLASEFVYEASGAVSSMKLGNGNWETAKFNNRLQPIELALGNAPNSTNLWKVNFDYGGDQNDGNVKSQQISVPINGTTQPYIINQTFNYDSLNRLINAKEMIGANQQWKQTFTFDRYGNRKFDTSNNNTTTLQSGCLQNICNPSVNITNNRLVGTSYDRVGNITIDASGQNFDYDAENKQVQVSNTNGVLGKYFYDGDGKRIKKIVPSTNEKTIFVYNASGKMVAEYSTITASATEAKVSYLTNDHLGSPRITTDGNGAVISRRDFMPFGETISRANYGIDNVKQKFTGYERDNETELDFAQARYYNKNLGRFNSVDPLMMSAKANNPQTFNRYIYVGNNPMNVTDPFGLDWVTRLTSDGEYEEYEFEWMVGKKLEKALNNGWTRVPIVNGVFRYVGKRNGKDAGIYELRANGGESWFEIFAETKRKREEAARNADAGGLNDDALALAKVFQNRYETSMNIVTTMMIIDGVIIALPLVADAVLVGGVSEMTTLGLTEAATALPTGIAVLNGLLSSIPRWEQLANKMQGVVQGNAAQTFRQITEGATKINDKVYRLSDGRVVTLYPSSTNGIMTIQVQSGIKIVVRFTQ